MAISAGFKQACPSCEALVPIRDARMIGKKIDCPRCKYRFLVEDPAAADKEAVAGATGGAAAGAAAKTAKDAIQDKSSKTAVRPGKAKTGVDDVDEVADKPKGKT